VVLVGILAAIAAVGPSSVAAHSAAESRASADTAYRKGDYALCAEAYVTALELETFSTSTAYNAACCFALAGEVDSAYIYLAHAIRGGFQDTQLLESDSDLEALRADTRWAALLAEAEELATCSRRMWDGPAFRTAYQPDLPAEQKIAGLSRLWSEVKFNFVNFDLVPELDWDSLYLATLPEVLASDSTKDYYELLMGMIAKLRDGHTNIQPPAELRDAFRSRPGLETRLVENTVLVVAVHDPAISGITVGDEVMAIDGTPVHEYADARVRPYQAASTPQDLDARSYGTALLQGPADEPVRLTLRGGGGNEVELVVPRLTTAALRDAVPPRAPMSWNMLAGGIAHVQLTTFNVPAAAELFLDAFDEIATATALILDVRDNGGGNSSVGWKVLACLTDEPFPSARWHTRDYRPAHRAWGRPEARFTVEARTISPDPDRTYHGPVVVLTSPRTYSAAEDFALSFDLMERGVILGETTGGSTGQPVSISLPGGGSARICTKRDTYPDGSEFVGVGIRPDVAVIPTVEGLRDGVDTVLEAAIAHLGSVR
jgi:C-terminal processing protease CtpA/Prc